MHEAENFARKHFAEVRALARRAVRHPAEAADVESDAMLGLLHAARTVDEQRSPGPAWARYKAGTEIVNGRRQRLRRLGDRQPHHVDAIRAIAYPASLDAPAAGGEDRIADVLPDPRDHLAVVDERLLLHRALRILTHQQRHVLRRRFGEDAPLSSIADDLGVTESRVSQITTSALARLRSHLTDLAAEQPAW